MKNDWQLVNFELELQTFGENKGKYTGKIRFQNGDFESFRFNIKPEMAKPYINLIAKEIVASADSLAKQLIESLNLEEL